MGSAAVASHALSCHRVVALSRGSPKTSSQRTLLQRTGLLALPRRVRASSSHGHSRIRRRRATADHALLEPSTSIDVDDIVAEAPALLALSSDLDWERYVTELREEAFRGLSGGSSERNVALEQLGAVMDGRVHDSMFDSIMQPSLHQDARDPQEELSVRIRVEELRCQAALQAAEVLASGVDGSFDWEAEAAELRQCVENQERGDLEQKLWNSWESARQGMEKDAERLHDEALKIQQMDGSYFTLFPDASKDSNPVENGKGPKKALEISGTWWTLAALATAAGLFGSQALAAIAADESAPAAVAEATREAPSWVAPTVLGFPVVSYLLFTLYRNKVNPYAKVTDWIFGLIATAIIANIVLIATIGVRLY